MTTPPHEPPPPPDPQPYQPYASYPQPSAGAPPTPGAPPAPGTQPGYGVPPGPMPGYGMPTYGMPPQPGAYGEMPPGYGPPQAYFPYAVMVKRPYDGLAIASLVLACAASLGLCTYGAGGVLGIVGAILGHVARKRLKSNGREGNGLALAGIIVGWALAAISVVILAGMIVLFTQGNDDSF